MDANYEEKVLCNRGPGLVTLEPLQKRKLSYSVLNSKKFCNCNAVTLPSSGKLKGALVHSSINLESSRGQAICYKNIQFEFKLCFLFKEC